MRYIGVFILMWVGGGLQGQSFQQFLDRIHGVPVGERQAVADSFMVAAKPFPFIEDDSMVHFVYNSPAASVAMAGDATDWNPDKIFTAIDGCNFRYFSTSYEADARLDYKLVVNGSNWILDPGNPNTCTGGFGPNSELRMPGCPVPPETKYYSDIAHGTLHDTTFHSTSLGNNRQVKIYLPSGYPSGMEAYPLILFHDGLEYVTLCNAKNTLDYLIAKKMMAPVIAVFVPPVDRVPEYEGAKIDLFTNFIVNELMPVIDARYKTSKDPNRRAMAGASDGGNISLYIGIKHPESFGKIAAQSSNVISTISNGIATGPKLNLSFYLDIGTYDIGMLIPLVNNFRDLLASKDYSCQFNEWHEGHSWGNWKEHLRHPLMLFFPTTMGLNTPNDQPNNHLGPNRPNPFHGRTVIPYSAPIGSAVELNLFDMSGKKLETLCECSMTSNETCYLYAHKHHGGQFIVTLTTNGILKESMTIIAQ